MLLDQDEQSAEVEHLHPGSAWPVTQLRQVYGATSLLKECKTVFNVVRREEVEVGVLFYGNLRANRLATPS